MNTHNHNHGDDTDLTVVQMTIISIFHNEGKSQKVLKRLAFQVLYESKVMENRLEGKTLSETGKGAQATGITSSLRDVKKSQYQLYKKWTEAGVGASRATMLQERSHNCHIPIISPLLNERGQTRHTWGKEKKNWTGAQWSKVAIYQEILEHFMLSSAEKLYEDA